MLVMKFGGSSLADGAALERTARLIAAEREPVVVVSAMDDTTEWLLEAGACAERGDPAACAVELARLRSLHLSAAGGDQGLAEQLEALIRDLESILEGVRLLRELTPRSRALIVSFGERLSALLMAGKLRACGRSAEAVDARALIVSDERYDGATVLREPTTERIRAGLQPLLNAAAIPVVTGYIAATPAGVTTTLGRSGSDYTATLIGAALGAEQIDIYTDVDGILSADPRLVKEARTLPQVSYREAAEMAYFGARVLHPRTITPAAEAGIPVRVRSTFLPERLGTLIAPTAPTLPLGVKTVTSIHGQALVTIEGRGMAGIPGVARRIFEAAELASVNVVMIAQSSSEQAVSLVVAEADTTRLIASLHERFAPELARGAVEQVAAQHEIAVVSVIGQGMAGTAGVSGRFFGALGHAHVNVLAIAQGGSELSISAAVREPEARRAVRASHTAFGLTRVINVALIGCGRVGGTLLRQLDQTRVRLQRELDLELRLVAVATSERMLFDTDGLPPAGVLEQLERAPARPSDEALIARLLEQRFSDGVLVDVTAADTTALHLAALEARLHVVTANKLPLSGSLSSYRRLQAASRGAGVRYNYETTFGAGLPLLHTLQELIHTGDRPLRISGCLSGTLGFLCSCLDEGMPLAEAVAEAERLGFTEPDPREDLSGRDVARKALIIARACGMALEPEDVQLEAVVPALEQGLQPALAAFAPRLAERVAAARAKGQVLRYVAEITEAGARVGLQEVPANGPIGSLRGPDNIVVFQTERYREHPLVIRGPGAGADVTAAGVLGDVLKTAGVAGRALGAAALEETL
ncbi:MAG: bifunctional aspartate kinase/homoserine dehydrogenase I [Proteobacteria bacterium]|nr:bifunctional aspartate kinase/homoserine dehydrogenase I [Pseudomonadota bacterium]